MRVRSASLAADVGQGSGAASRFDKVGEAHAAAVEGVGAREHHLAQHLDVLLGGVGGTAAYEHLVEGLQREARLSVDDEAVLQREAVGLGDDAVGGRRGGITHAARHVNLHR